MQKKVPAVHANWREFPCKDPDRGSGEWCVKETWKGQRLQCAPAAGPALVAFATPLALPCPTITPFFLLTSPLWASCGDLGLTSTQDWGCPKKRL